MGETEAVKTVVVKTAPSQMSSDTAGSAKSNPQR